MALCWNGLNPQSEKKTAAKRKKRPIERLSDPKSCREKQMSKAGEGQFAPWPLRVGGREGLGSDARVGGPSNCTNHARRQASEGARVASVGEEKNWLTEPGSGARRKLLLARRINTRSQVGQAAKRTGNRGRNDACQCGYRRAWSGILMHPGDRENPQTL